MGEEVSFFAIIKGIQIYLIRIIDKTRFQIYRSTKSDVMMKVGAFTSLVFVSWLLFIPFINGEDCAPSGSIENCDGCLKGSQCKSGFCCPFLKMCMASSSASCSRGTPAICRPMCYDSMDPKDCNCQNTDFPQKWPKVCKGMYIS